MLSLNKSPDSYSHQPGPVKPLWLWCARLSIWAAIGVANCFTNYFFTASAGIRISFWHVVGDTLFNYLCWALATPMIFYLALRYQISRQNWKFRVPLHVLGGIILTIVFTTVRIFAYPVRMGEHAEVQPVTMRLFWILFYYGCIDDSISIYWPTVGIAHLVSY